MNLTITRPRLDQSVTFQDVRGIDRQFGPDDTPTLAVTYLDPDTDSEVTEEFDGRNWFVENLSLTHEEQIAGAER